MSSLAWRPFTKPSMQNSPTGRPWAIVKSEKALTFFCSTVTSPVQTSWSHWCRSSAATSNALLPVWEALVTQPTTTRSNLWKILPRISNCLLKNTSSWTSSSWLVTSSVAALLWNLLTSCKTKFLVFWTLQCSLFVDSKFLDLRLSQWRISNHCQSTKDSTRWSRIKISFIIKKDSVSWSMFLELSMNMHLDNLLLWTGNVISGRFALEFTLSTSKIVSTISRCQSNLSMEWKIRSVQWKVVLNGRSNTVKVETLR